jgi:ribosomal protein L32
MLTPPTQAQLDHWQKLVPDVKAPRDFLANEAMLDYIASPAAQAHKSRRYRMGDRVNHLLRCQRCGEPFMSKRASAKYGSTKCRQRKPLLPERLCGNCGQPFQPLRSTGRFHKECRQRAYRVKIGSASV